MNGHARTRGVSGKGTHKKTHHEWWAVLKQSSARLASAATRRDTQEHRAHAKHRKRAAFRHHRLHHRLHRAAFDVANDESAHATKILHDEVQRIDAGHEVALIEKPSPMNALPAS